MILRFETALDLQLDNDQDRLILELAAIGIFEVRNPYQSLSTGKIPVVIGNVDEDITVEDAISSNADQKASRWQLPTSDLKTTHMAVPHRLNKRERDDSGSPGRLDPEQESQGVCLPSVL